MAGNLVLCWMCLQWKREVCNQNNPLVHIRIESIWSHTTCICKCTQVGAVSVQHIQILCFVFVYEENGNAQTFVVYCQYIYH